MSCTLKALHEKEDILPISVHDGETVIIGRNPSTQIKDPRCSRRQLEIVASYKLKTVKVKQIAINDSSINGIVIGVGLEKTARHGDVIEVLEGEFKYKIHFEGSRDTSDLEHTKPVKIPRMFNPKGAESFKKDSALEKGSWESYDDNKLLVYATGENIKESKSKVTAFDMDGTIITTKSGRVFPKDDLDWKFLYPTIQTKLQCYFAQHDDTKFVIITNQAGIGKGNTTVDGIKKKIENITRQIGIPVVVTVATGKSEYRKPMTGVWDVFVKTYNADVYPDLNSSLFCGDAAGRKKDHAKSDRLFALNLGIPFSTPEEFFLSQKPQEYEMPIFNPRALIRDFDNNTLPSNDNIQYPHGQEMIILVGFPASGKSTFAKEVLVPKSYVHINQDTLKTASKCLSTTESSLQSGLSVVIDNTNPDKKAREEYLKLAKKHRVAARCFKMNVDHAQTLHNNKFRELCKTSHAKIPPVAFNSFKSKFQEPSCDEGFTETVSVNFVPKFNNDTEKQLYGKFLMEK